MRLDLFWIGDYKNLKDVTVDFSEDHWVTVVIGWNGTGKSNVLEALATLFRDLMLGKNQDNEKNKPSFPYRLRYKMHDSWWVYIDADPKRQKNAYQIKVKQIEKNDESQEETSEDHGQLIALSKFLEERDKYLPKYIFGYYSGTCERLQDIFREPLRIYYKNLLDGQDTGLRRLLYALPVHSQFVLLAFLIQKDEAVKKLLNDQLGLEEGGIDSVLFVLRQPPWYQKNKLHKKGDHRFWTAEGVVQQFLDRLYKIALAPVRITRKVKKSPWDKGSDHEFLYLYLKDLDALGDLVGQQAPREFFQDLESTYISELLEEVRIRVKLRKNDGSVTFRELSEGEQQLLTVLGLLKFTAEEESLFLLDEPDTHLNPRWCVEYLDYLQKFIGTDKKSQESSHIVLTTHNPFAIAELVKEQVQILKRNPENLSIDVEPPDEHPRGLGFSGIVTSDMFGLETALDNYTLRLIRERNELLYKELKENITPADNDRLKEIYQELEEMGFNDVFDDPIFSEYVLLLEGEKKKRNIDKLDRYTRKNVLTALLNKLEKGEA